MQVYYAINLRQVIAACALHLSSSAFSTFQDDSVAGEASAPCFRSILAAIDTTVNIHHTYGL